MLLVASSLKLITEIALMAFAGQFLLGLLAGARRDQNLFYRILQTVTKPFVRLTRLISPKVVLDRHVPLAAFLLTVFLWIAATLWKIRLCFEIGVQLCR